MTLNLSNYRVGDRLLIQRNDGQYTPPVEVKLLEKAPKRIKIEVLSQGWWGLGTIHWTDTDTNLKEHWLIYRKL